MFTAYLNAYWFILYNPLDLSFLYIINPSNAYLLAGNYPEFIRYVSLKNLSSVTIIKLQNQIHSVNNDPHSIKISIKNMIINA